MFSTIFDQTVDALEMPRVQYAYQLDPEKAKMHSSNLKVENVITIFI